jgi:hypothetical protein
MNPSTLSEPHPSVPLQTEKQSIESDSSSSVNMDSEHADAIGTPMILVGSDSGKDLPAVAEEKGDAKLDVKVDVTVDVTVSTEVVQNGSTHVDAELTSPLKPLAKRIQAMPEKIIRYVSPSVFHVHAHDWRLTVHQLHHRTRFSAFYRRSSVCTVFKINTAILEKLVVTQPATVC